MLTQEILKLTKAGGSPEEIAQAMQKMLDAETARVIKERDARARERRIENNRRDIRNKVFAGKGYTKTQQISLLYDYLADNADHVKSWMAQNKFRPATEVHLENTNLENGAG